MNSKFVEFNQHINNSKNRKVYLLYSNGSNSFSLAVTYFQYRERNKLETDKEIYDSLVQELTDSCLNSKLAYLVQEGELYVRPIKEFQPKRMNNSIRND